MTQEKPSSATQIRCNPTLEIAAGVLSGIAETLATHPVDQIKTQAHVHRGAAPDMVSSLLAQASEGGLSRLYRGVGAACLRPQALCMYTGNEWCKRIVSRDKPLTHRTAPIAGFLSGYIEAVAVTPFEVVKRYTSSANCAYNMISKEGMQSIYTGFGATCARNCTFNGVFFGGVFTLKNQLPPEETTVGEFAQDFGVGMAASAFATCVKQPLDVVKSCIQNQVPGAGERKYKNVLQALWQLARMEGARGLYRGFAPTLVRTMTGQSVAFASFEFCLTKLQLLQGAVPDEAELGGRLIAPAERT